MTDPQKSVEAVWRIESTRLIAGLTRMVRDVSWAEDLAQDALVAALEAWPRSGVPQNPGAWLMAVAKRRAIDGFRRQRRFDDRQRALGHEAEGRQDDYRPDLNLDALDIGDNVLRLVFFTCHPVLSPEARVTLTLRLLGGLTTAEIARAYVVGEATIAQRIVRAKRTLVEAKVPFEVPRGADLEARLDSVLRVIYLVFNEGYSATSGDDWTRPALCHEALRLGRMVAGLVPNAGEVHGLVALMDIQASRLPARINAQGEPILLPDQDRSKWDRVLIRHGLASLARAETLGPLGPYALQAAIAACHARAPRAQDTDWTKMAALYDALAELAPSPIVELNRAVAVSMAYGPASGLELLDQLEATGALDQYHLLPSVRGDLLFKVGRLAEARSQFLRAADLTQNTRERELLLGRAGECGSPKA